MSGNVNDKQIIIIFSKDGSKNARQFEAFLREKKLGAGWSTKATNDEIMFSTIVQVRNPRQPAGTLSHTIIDEWEAVAQKHGGKLLREDVIARKVEASSEEPSQQTLVQHVTRSQLPREHSFKIGSREYRVGFRVHIDRAEPRLYVDYKILKPSIISDSGGDQLQQEMAYFIRDRIGLSGITYQFHRLKPDQEIEASPSARR